MGRRENKEKENNDYRCKRIPGSRFAQECASKNTDLTTKIEHKSEFDRLVTAARPKVTAPPRPTMHPTSSPYTETKGPPLLIRLSLTEAGDSILDAEESNGTM